MFVLLVMQLKISVYKEVCVFVTLDIIQQLIIKVIYNVKNVHLNVKSVLIMHGLVHFVIQARIKSQDMIVLVV